MEQHDWASGVYNPGSSPVSISPELQLDPTLGLGPRRQQPQDRSVPLAPKAAGEGSGDSVARVPLAHPEQEDLRQEVPPFLAVHSERLSRKR